jgi:Transposase IS66 family
VQISRLVTEWLLPMRECPCCGQVTTAAAPPGVHAGTISYGPAVNTAAVLLAAYGNVPAERAAHLIAMLLGMPVSPGFVDKASARLDGTLQHAGFDDAMQAALAAEPALGADETPVNVLTPDNDPQTGESETGSPHVLVIRTPGGNLTWLRALGSRRAEAITTILGFFTGFLITDGYTAYQQLLPKLAGIQQCAAHVIRRCRAVAGLGPGSLQSWAADIIEILREAHHLTEQARARDGPTMRNRWPSSASATTRPSPSGSPTTGTGTGTTATTPATSSAAGCATTPARSGCSPASPPSTGPTTPPSAAPRSPSGTRPSPDTGTTSVPSPGGAASAATSTPPPRTA